MQPRAPPRRPLRGLLSGPHWRPPRGWGLLSTRGSPVVALKPATIGAPLNLTASQEKPRVAKRASLEVAFVVVRAPRRPEETPNTSRRGRSSERPSTGKVAGRTPKGQQIRQCSAGPSKGASRSGGSKASSNLAQHPLHHCPPAQSPSSQCTGFPRSPLGDRTLAPRPQTSLLVERRPKA